MILAFLGLDFTRLIDAWDWYVWGIDNCGSVRNGHQWAEDCSNSYRNQ